MLGNCRITQVVGYMALSHRQICDYYFSAGLRVGSFLGELRFLNVLLTMDGASEVVDCTPGLSVYMLDRAVGNDMKTICRGIAEWASELADACIAIVDGVDADQRSSRPEDVPATPAEMEQFPWIKRKGGGP